jgi:outer membrane protein
VVLLSRIAAASLLAGALASSVHAQERLTLEDAIRRALAANPRAVGAQADVEAAAARTSEARSAFLPRVDLTESWQRGDQPVYVFSSLLMQRRFTAADFSLDSLNHPDAFTNHRAAVTVEQTLYDGGRSRASAGVAELRRQGVAADRERILASLRLDTIRGYARVLAAVADVTAAASAHEAAAEDYARVKQRQGAGLETDAAVLALQVSVDEAEVGRIRASGEEAIARAQLSALIGAPLDARFELDPLVTSDVVVPEPAAAETEAVKSRPEAHAAALAVSSAQVALQGTRRALLPDLAAIGSVEANGRTLTDRTSAWGAGLQVKWNVFAGGGDAARIRAGSAALRSAQAQRDAADEAVRLDARTAAIAARTAAAAERASRVGVDQARESQRIVRNRYEAGLATATDLLRAAETVTRAEAGRTRALLDARVAIAELARAMGRETIQ